MVSVGPSAPASMAVVAPVATVHEEMQDRAQKEDRPGENAQDVRLVFLPEEEDCDRQEPEHYYP